jgi:hypothetical protein
MLARYLTLVLLAALPNRAQAALTFCNQFQRPVSVGEQGRQPVGTIAFLSDGRRVYQQTPPP